MYTLLRTGRVFAYDSVEQRFEEHQSKWPEAIFNEDSYYKYIAPLVAPEDDNSTAEYLGDLQGSKTEQRKWWLYNRFKYLDSKYNAGDAMSDYVAFRGYAKSNITITPYADVYASAKYGSYLVQTRAERNKSYTLICPLDNVNDTEIAIYSVSQLSSIGDLSGLKIGSADFSKATKLTELKVGNRATNYSNPNLVSLAVGNNTLLKKLDARNCTNLAGSINVSGCKNIEEVYLSGTKVTGVNLPNGGNLNYLQLPGTVTNLTIRNQSNLQTLYVPNPGALVTLWIENTPNVDVARYLRLMSDGGRIRLIGMNLTLNSASDVVTLYDNFDRMSGLDENGYNIPKPQITGTIYVPSISSPELEALTARYSGITINYSTLLYSVSFYNGDELIQIQDVRSGGTVTYSGTTPKKDPTETVIYTFAGWSLTNGGEIDSNALTNVTEDRNVYAVYGEDTRLYTVEFYNSDGTTLLESKQYEYNEKPVYNGSTPSKGDANYQFIGWIPALTEDTIVTSDIVFVAHYKSLYAPMIGPKSWNGSISKSSVTSVRFIKDYEPTTFDTYWDASYRGDETVFAYATGNDIVITWSEYDKLGCYENMTGMFAGCGNIASLDLSLVDFSGVTTLTQAFYYCSGLGSLTFDSTLTGWSGADISISSTGLDKAATLAALDTLPTITESKTITVKSNLITATEAASAISKGWNVAGTLS